MINRDRLEDIEFEMKAVGKRIEALLVDPEVREWPLVVEDLGRALAAMQSARDDLGSI